jgi:DNA-binding LacI/PurR family transcriptional regulator
MPGMTTMVDIAKRAGVALSTVSHTLSGKRPVSPEVRERVLRAMEELEYQPHALGRALRNKRTKTIGVLFPAYAFGLSSLQLEFVSGIAEVATQHGYALYLWSSFGEDQEILQMTQQGLIDGLVLLEIQLHDLRVESLKRRGFPFVMIGYPEDPQGVSYVDLDFPAAMHTSIEYLARLGHQRIAFLNTDVALERHLAYAIRAHESFLHEISAFRLTGKAYASPADIQQGYAFVQHLLTEDRSLSALVTINPWIVGSTIRALYDYGLTVPDHFSVLAITSPVLAEMMVPSITTVDYPYNQAGRAAAEMLIRQLDEKDTPVKQILLPPKFTPRQSTGRYLPEKTIPSSQSFPS